MYVCGPTVQSPPHIGHMRSGVAADITRRWLAASGYDVLHLRNVTDIDDKILVNAAAAGRAVVGARHRGHQAVPVGVPRL